jgi:6-phosphogluconolactonase
MSTSDGPSDARRDIRWVGFATLAELQQAASRRIIGAARRAIAQRGEFLIVLAGGNTPRDVYRLLRDGNTDWSRWNAFFGDERCVPVDDPQRNSKMAADEWLDHVLIPKHRVHPLPAELGARAAALAYADTLRGVGEFDLVLLGLGEDGHTASLFPNHDWGTAPNAPDVLAVFDAPKPPPQRVSLSAARLSRACEVVFLVAGANKRTALTRWRAGARLPANAIRPPNGVDVLFDAELLTQPR